MEFRSQPLSSSPHFPTRTRISAAIIAVACILLFLRIGYLTIIRGEAYAQAAQDNLRTSERIDAPRGNIFDRNGKPVAISRKAYSITYSRRYSSPEQVNETLRLLSEMTGEDFLSAKDTILGESRWTRHQLARRLPHERIVPVLERQHELPGVRVQDDFTREYPFGPGMALIAGYTGKITAEDAHLYKRPLYLMDDYVGRAGVEKQYEAELIGKPGVRRLTTDARGRALDEPVIEKEARAGEDLYLTIDGDLQNYATELLGTETGSILLMDARTGAVITMASTPTFDPAQPALSKLNGRDVSYLNRAYRGLYPPGSTFKIVTASAAMKHAWGPEHSVTCTGNFKWPGWDRAFWCDARSGHGATDMRRAIQVSCNVYFYESAYELGSTPLVEEARRFGFASKSGIDLPGEMAGSFQRSGGNPEGGELLNFAIGQGQFLATPLQVAAAYAAVANGGELIQPYVVGKIESADKTESRITPKKTAGILALTPSQRQVLIDGLYRGANQRGGTAFRVGFPPEWQICGKTGTAENGQGGIDAWFACFFPRDNPRYVAVAHVEQAEGHGGDVAGPLVKQLIEQALAKGALSL